MASAPAPPARKQPLVPHATSSLALFFDFDLSAVPGHAELPGRDHAAAAAAVVAASGLAPPGSAKARAVLTDGAATLLAAQALPFEPWHQATPEVPVRIEFLYSTATPTQLAVRVLTHLPAVDGVSATRIALHTLEALEGAPVCAGPPFKTNPHFTFGLRHRVNMARQLAYVAWDANVSAPRWWCGARAPTPAELDQPVRPKLARAYYAQPGGGAPAAFTTYAPADGPAAYKRLVAASDEWMRRARLRGLFNLINLAGQGQGLVAASIVPAGRDLLDMAARMRWAFTPPDHPRGGDFWEIMNMLHCRVLFVNNYGRHTLSSKAVCTQFLWDWLGMSAPVPGLGVITINGATLAWARWTPGGLRSVEALLEGALGAPKTRLTQSLGFVEAAA